MAKYWDKEINMNTDWGGDASTENLPVSGRRIQEFIKTTLGNKAGCFYYDTANNRYLVFSDVDSKDAYLDNPQDNAGLLLAFFDAPFNYSAEVNLITNRFVPVLAGTSGNYIEFTFDVLNKSGQSVGEDVVCTYTFVRGSVRKVVTQKYRSGTKVRFNIDDYIEVGTNNITIGIVGKETLAATTIGVTYQVVDLKLEDTFDISQVYDLSNTNQIEVPYSIMGYGAKILEWYLDGEPVPYNKNDDEITEVSTSRVKYLSIEGLSQGAHSVQFRAYTIINGEKFYSKTLYREFIVYTRENSIPIVAVATELPLGAPIIEAGEELRLYGVSQYLPYDIKLALFNPTYASVTPVGIYLDDALLTTLSMQNNKEVIYGLVVTSYGEKTLKIGLDLVTREIAMDVTKSSTSIEELNQGLSLALSATGKSNDSADRNVWKYGSFSTLFTGFKWNSVSGWNNGELNISGGASIITNCAPLAADVTVSGKTLEFEFSTKNVSNTDAVICDLRNANGVGLLITASEASLTSSGGAKVSTRYKSGENVRLSFVINRKSGTTNKGLIFMYVNGVLSGAANYALNDNFISSETLSIASNEDVDIALKSLRFYDVPLTDSQILNNYILYRSNAEEFLKVYTRNNIYEENSSDFSTDILSGQLPIMIITGNIPALEATTDKNLQIDVDVEYINLQDQSRSFKLKNGAMRPQGTSSMSYPKKNFRLYTSKKDSTVLYDADGNVVADRLYAFKEGAQPVNCWCFKADYAESSGTHNTGIARIWNDAMKNAQIGGEYKCRTSAQKSAIEQNYPYDVRTTIDGFPILMFYRLTENDPLIFIGKYNFNNDKSTESVFGFKNIPGFDNTKMQCWEVLNNGNHLALFTDTNNWNTEWSNAFEGRYPDGNTNTGDLKIFADWMSTVTQANFAGEKWSHLDVYKIAAYYIYLMRFGAVDQVVKNAMFTSEDGVHWYYINYDNDTINGLRNDGLLAYPPTITRQTLDESFSTTVYAYAGHDSRLWNMLEADTEFMGIVSEVDAALYSAGLSYDSIIDVFDKGQSGKWCERVYNQDAQYKYIGPFVDRGVNNLFMLQGSRQSHRRWWLSERFALLDAKFVSGEYKANSFEVKLAGAPIGLEFSIKAGADMTYGYGVNNVPIQYGIELERGDSHTFSTTSVLNIGDPLRLYAAPYLEKIDISNFAPYLGQIAIAHVYSDRLGSKLRTLIIGKSGVENTSLAELSGINQAISLTTLDISGLKGIKSLDLTSNTLIEVVAADDSGLTSLTLPVGAPTELLSLPASLQALTLNGLYMLNNEGISIQNNGCNLTTVEISDCPLLNTQTIVETWTLYKNSEHSECSLILTGIEWGNVDVEWLLSLTTFRVLSLKGKISVSSITEEQLTQLQQAFGKNCFSSASELYIQVPSDSNAYFVGPTTVRGLSSTQYELIVASGSNGTTTISIEGGGSSGITIQNGYLIVGDISSDVQITLLAMFIPEEGAAIVRRKTVQAQKISYPTNATISGATEITKKGVVPYQIALGSYDSDALFYATWSISGDAVTDGYVALGTTSEEGANVIVNTLEESSFTLKVVLRKSSNDSIICTKVKEVQVLVGGVIMTSTSNPKMMSLCYQVGHPKGYVAKSSYMTDVEASMFLDASPLIGNAVSFGNYTTFNEFVHFVNTLPISYINSYITEITLPWTELTDMRITGKTVHCPNLQKIIATDLTLTSKTLGFKISNNVSLPALKKIHGDFYLECSSTTAKPVINLSALEELKGRIRCSYLTVRVPKLKEITIAYMGSYTIYVLGNNDEWVCPLLESVTFEDYSSSYTYSLIGTSDVRKISLPVLTELPVPLLKYSESYNLLNEIDLPLIETLSLGTWVTCNSLTELNLPSVKTLKESYIKSTSLESVSMPNIENIGVYPKEGVAGKDCSLLFYYCDSLVEFEGILNVKELYGRDLFNSINSNVIFGESITFPNLEVMAAWGTAGNITGILHSNLKHFSAPKLKVFVDAFKDCAELETVSMPLVETIGGYSTFLNCSTLQEVDLSNVVNLQNTSAMFYGCTALTKITLGVTSLVNTRHGVLGLYTCTALEELNLPNLTTISSSYNFEFSNDSDVSNTNTPDKFFGSKLSAPKLNISSSRIRLRSLQNLVELDLSSMEEFCFKRVYNCPLLENIILSKCVKLVGLYDESNPSSTQCPLLKNVRLSLTEGVTLSNHVLADTNIEKIEGYFETIEYKAFGYAKYLREIRAYCPQATDIKNANGGSMSLNSLYFTDVGSEVPSDVVKTIHVLENATGYEDANWVKKLMQVGFTLVKDLQAPSDSDETE